MIFDTPNRTIGASAVLLATCMLGTTDGALAQSQSGDLSEPALEQVLVSASRTAEDGSALALSWSRIDDSAIRDTAAIHINQLMQRSAGVWISRGNGQERLPSLRSPASGAADAR